MPSCDPVALLEQALRDAEVAYRSRDTQMMEAALKRLRNFREVAPEAPVCREHARPSTLHALRQPRTPGVRSAALPREQFFTWTRAA